jgi:hypothetical protein
VKREKKIASELAHPDIAGHASMRLQLTSVRLHLAGLNIWNFGSPIDFSLIASGGCNAFTSVKRNK